MASTPLAPPAPPTPPTRASITTWYVPDMTRFFCRIVHCGPGAAAGGNTATCSHEYQTQGSSVMEVFNISYTLTFQENEEHWNKFL